MANTLDKAWKEMRGFEIQAVGIASISYDDESRRLINMRNKGAMLGDPSVREGYVQDRSPGVWKRPAQTKAGREPLYGHGHRYRRPAAASWAWPPKPICSKCNNSSRLNNRFRQSPRRLGLGPVLVDPSTPASSVGMRQPKTEASFCPNCGNNQGNKSAKFCPECGHALN